MVGVAKLGSVWCVCVMVGVVTNLCISKEDLTSNIRCP